MILPYEKRGRWIAVINGLTRKFMTEEEALEALESSELDSEETLELEPKQELQQEFKWGRFLSKEVDG